MSATPAPTHVNGSGNNHQQTGPIAQHLTRLQIDGQQPPTQQKEQVQPLIGLWRWAAIVFLVVSMIAVTIYLWVNSQPWYIVTIPSILGVPIFAFLTYTSKESWTGLGGYEEVSEERNASSVWEQKSKKYVRGKTLWDWMQLLAALAVPLALGLATYSFNAQQAVSAQDQQHEAALQSYIDHMSDLLLGNNAGKNSPLLSSCHIDDDTRQVARSRTLAVLRILDGRRKGFVLQFLYDSQLIGFYSGHEDAVNDNFDNRDSRQPYINLEGADLSGAELNNAFLEYARLRNVDLRNAELKNAHLHIANLQGADLRGANLDGANLQGADLQATDLRGANLDGADLYETHLLGANLSGVHLGKANLDRTDLSGSYLNIADAQPHEC